MHHTVEIAVPAQATGEVLAQLQALEGVVGLSVERGASVKPPGDVVTAHVLNREVDAALAVAMQARHFGSVSVTTSEAKTVIDEHSARAIDDDTDESPCEEVERSLRHNGRLTLNFLTLMGSSGLIAVAGLLSDPVPQALALAAASLIAPAFEPMVHFTVGLMRGSWYTIQRALVAVVSGYLCLAAAGASSYLLLHWLGTATDEALTASAGLKTLAHPTAADWLISTCGAAAGAVILTAFRKAVIAGALIALSVVPAAALVGAGLVAGDIVMALEALKRVGIVTVLVIGLSAAIILAKQRFIHHNRTPMLWQDNLARALSSPVASRLGGDSEDTAHNPMS